jgi:hypothetical protein
MKKLILLATLLLSTSASANFFEENEAELEAEERREQAQQSQLESQKKQQVSQLLSTPCPGHKKRRKIALILYENNGAGTIKVNNPEFNRLFQTINQGLRNEGLRTYSQAAITRQIAQAEIAAVANGDPDAAIAAAGKLGAYYFLTAHINTRNNFNQVLHINEVFVDMTFSLNTARGKPVTTVNSDGDVWAQQDIQSAALSIIRDKSNLIIAKLYHGVCHDK